MTREPDGRQPHPPMPPQPPRLTPVPPEPPRPTPDPPEPAHHGPPAWSWWVVGILIPVVGVLATVFAQSSNKDSGDASPAAGASATARESAAVDVSDSPEPEETASGSDLTTLEPSPSDTATVKILKRGEFTLPVGNSADLENGTVGESVKAPDIYLAEDVAYFSGMNGRVAHPSGGATAKTCATALAGSEVKQTGNIQDGFDEGTWYCIPTSANHLAGVQWLSTSDEGERFHYIVWDMPAPSSDTD
ncbi:hypothetical protein [Streptomyces sp. NPDC050255]|uniref:hypothetical protein n=1 Tax=Streptomyces sp. NPDC050255 TaxID=3365606 RepID=UPI0037A6AC74